MSDNRAGIEILELPHQIRERAEEILVELGVLDAEEYDSPFRHRSCHTYPWPIIDEEMGDKTYMCAYYGPGVQTSLSDIHTLWKALHFTNHLDLDMTLDYVLIDIATRPFKHPQGACPALEKCLVGCAKRSWEVLRRDMIVGEFRGELDAIFVCARRGPWRIEMYS